MSVAVVPTGKIPDDGGLNAGEPGIIARLSDRDPFAVESDVRDLLEMLPSIQGGSGGKVPQMRFRGDQVGIALRA